MDRHSGLVVNGGREHLALLAGDGGVGVDELGHYATHSLDTQCQRSYVEQYDVAHAALLVEDGTLDGSTDGYYLIGVYTLRRLLAEVVLYQSLNGRNTA